MKLKSFLLISLFSFLLIPCFSNASEMIDEGMIQVNIPEEVNISGRGYSFYLDGNIYTDGYGQYLYWKNNGINKTLQYIYGWDNGRLYFFGTTTDLNNRITQGYINSFCKASSVSGCFPVGTSYTIVSADDFYLLNPNITKIAVGNTSVALDWSNNDWGFYLCYYNNNDSNYYCAISAPVPYGGDIKWSSLTGSLGFTSIDNAKTYDWELSNLNGSSSNSDTFYFSTGSCPSVGQLKSSSNLTPAVCYGGYGSNVMYGDQVAFVGGSGMSIFDVYNDYLTTFSDHSMNIQTWYDTYWVYYQNIAHDSRPFEGLKKSYLGLQFARQTFGNTRGFNGSYMILNYCYYVVNNIPDNTSTCVGSNISTQYSGVVMTDQDIQDIVDAVNDSYIVHRPGIGSIFNDPNAGLGGGGSSWGDDECSGIPCLFDRFYQMFTSSRINDVDFSAGGQGILPQYIALAFVVVVLFYVFKR